MGSCSLFYFIVDSIRSRISRVLPKRESSQRGKNKIERRKVERVQAARLLFSFIEGQRSVLRGLNLAGPEFTLLSAGIQLCDAMNDSRKVQSPLRNSRISQLVFPLPAKRNETKKDGDSILVNDPADSAIIVDQISRSGAVRPRVTSKYTRVHRTSRIGHLPDPSNHSFSLSIL